MNSETSHSQSDDPVSTGSELSQLIEALNQLLVQLTNQLQQLPRETALEIVQLCSERPGWQHPEICGDAVDAHSEMALERLTDIILGRRQPVN
jgi:hypothetical protein